MQSSDSFKADETLAVLLIGEPGTGKTNVAMAFPDPYFISTDRKLGNAVKRYPGKRFWFDYPDSGPDGKPLAIKDRWTRINTLIAEAGEKPEIKTIVLDNLSDAGDWCQHYILSCPAMSKGGRPRVAGAEVMEQSDWQGYYVLMSNMLTNLKTRGKTVVVCCHEATDKDEVSGVIRYFPRIGGKLRDTLPSLFSNYWQCAVTVSGVDRHRYHVRTKPTARMNLINSLGLPGEFDFSWDEVAKALAKP